MPGHVVHGPQLVQVVQLPGTVPLSCVCLNVNGDLVVTRECPEMIECMNGNDIVLFSETWTNEHSNLDIDDFNVFSKHRVKKKNARRDSGGLVCYFRKNVAKGVSEIKWLFEDGMCFKLDKDYFGWERDVIQCVQIKAPVFKPRF